MKPDANYVQGFFLGRPGASFDTYVKSLCASLKHTLSTIPEDQRKGRVVVIARWEPDCDTDAPIKS